MWSGMSALTRWWPAVATVSPCGQRPAEEAALQGLGRALQADIVLRRCEDDPGRRLGLGLLDFDEVAGADPGIGALQAVEADDVEPLVVAIGADGAGGGQALAGDLDDVAFGQPHFGHQLDRQAGDPAAGIAGRQIGDLQPLGQLVRHPPCEILSRPGHGPAAQTAPARMGSMWALAARVKGGGARSAKKGRAMRPPGPEVRRGCHKRPDCYRTAAFIVQVRNGSTLAERLAESLSMW